MSVSDEGLLAILLLALYVHDRMALTAPTAVFLVRMPFAGWFAAFPTARFTWARRRVFSSALLPPAMPIFALDWKADTARATPQTALDATSLGSLSIASGFAFCSVLVLVPLALLTHRSTLVLLVAFATAYAGVFACVATLWASKRRLELPNSFCAKLTAEMILCPPIAANLVCRVSLRKSVELAFIPAARHLVSPIEWRRTCFELARRIDIELESVETGTGEYESLKSIREQIA